MPLNGASVLSGATMSPTGGTAISFTSAGIRNNSVTLNCDADTDFRTRRQITCSISEPKVATSAPNGYTQARSVALIKLPKTLANGKVTVNTLRIEFARDVETSAADITEAKVIGAQVLNDPDFDALFEDLSLA